MSGTRYVSITRESTYASPDIVSNNLITSEFAESNLDVAGDTAIELNRGFGRTTRHMAPGPYIPQGDITSVLSVEFFPHIISGLGEYFHSNNIHYFWNTDGRDLPSYQIQVGKDVIEQVFHGCTLNSITLSCEKEYGDVTANYVCANDTLNGPAKGIEDLAPIQETPISFTQVKVAIDGEDKTSERVLNSLSIAIENNVNAEDGVGLGDNHSKKMVAGEASTTVDFENLFTDDYFLTMFKQGGTHTLELTFTDENSNYVKFYFPAIFLKNSQQNASGREVIKQPLSFKAMAGNCQAGERTINTDCLISVKNGETQYNF